MNVCVWHGLTCGKPVVETDIETVGRQSGQQLFADARDEGPNRILLNGGQLIN